MKTIKFSLSENTVLYCPSTGEEILSHRPEGLNYLAEALIAGWFSESSSKPMIKDLTLKSAWEEFLRLEFKKEPVTDEMLNKFLGKYKEPHWVVYTNAFDSSNTGVDHNSAWYVVLADTIIIEEDE